MDTDDTDESVDESDVPDTKTMQIKGSSETIPYINQVVAIYMKLNIDLNEAIARVKIPKHLKEPVTTFLVSLRKEGLLSRTEGIIMNKLNLTGREKSSENNNEQEDTNVGTDQGEKESNGEAKDSNDEMDRVEKESSDGTDQGEDDEAIGGEESYDEIDLHSLTGSVDYNNKRVAEEEDDDDEDKPYGFLTVSDSNNDNYAMHQNKVTLNKNDYPVRDYKTVDEMNKTEKYGPIPNLLNGSFVRIKQTGEEALYYNGELIVQPNVLVNATRHFTTLHRLLTRRICSAKNKVLHEHELVALYEKCVIASGLRTDILKMDVVRKKSTLWKFINEEINPALATYNIEMKKILDEISNKFCYVYLPIHADFLPNYMAKQKNEKKIFMEYVGLLLERISSDPNHFLTYQNAVNLHKENATLKRLTKAEVSKHLNEMKLEKYIIEKSGKIYVGPKGTAYFPEIFQNRTKKCAICDEISVMGNTCDNCESNYHAFCFQKYIDSGGAQECITCKNSLPLERYGVPKPSPEAKKAKKKKKQAASSVGSSSDVTEHASSRESTPEVTQQDGPSVRTANARKRGNPRGTAAKATQQGSTSGSPAKRRKRGNPSGSAAQATQQVSPSGNNATTTQQETAKATQQDGPSGGRTAKTTEQVSPTKSNVKAAQQARPSGSAANATQPVSPTKSTAKTTEQVSPSGSSAKDTLQNKPGGSTLKDIQQDGPSGGRTAKTTEQVSPTKSNVKAAQQARPSGSAASYVDDTGKRPSSVDSDQYKSLSSKHNKKNKQQHNDDTELVESGGGKLN